MAKKKAKKKAIRKAVVKFPSSRELSLDMLTKVHACYTQRLAFVQGFKTFGSVSITRNVVDNLSDEDVARFSVNAGLESFLLSTEGQSRFKAAVRRSTGYDLDDEYGYTPNDDVDFKRSVLAALARAYIRYPNRGLTA
jgi:hypothetical protein